MAVLLSQLEHQRNSERFLSWIFTAMRQSPRDFQNQAEYSSRTQESFPC